MGLVGRPPIDGGRALDIEWAVAGRPIPGERVSGDSSLVERRGQAVLIGVVDGLGHGPEAAAAAECAVEVLRGFAGDDLDLLFSRCDAALRSTRGAVVSVSHVDLSTGTLKWAGIGNVMGVLLRTGRVQPPRERLAPRPGVVGARPARPRPETIRVNAGDTLVLGTDGLSQSFCYSFDPAPGSPPDRLAREVIAAYWQGHDDALVLVARLKEA